jgi:hypothetical protein
VNQKKAKLGINLNKSVTSYLVSVRSQGTITTIRAGVMKIRQN